MEKGADYNTINNYGVPLLFLALHLNDIEYIISLVNDKTRNKIDINILDNNGYTPLISSYNNKYMDIFNYLIDYSDINQKDKYGHSILYYAIKNNDSTNANNLINIGAKIDEDIMDAVFDYSSNTISDILDNDNMPQYYINGKKFPLLNELILRCSSYLKYSLLEKLLIKGYNVNIKDNEGNTPLICAVKQKDKSIIKLLIKYGAITSMKNINGKKAIDFSSCKCRSFPCSCGYGEICYLLKDQ